MVRAILACASTLLVGCAYQMPPTAPTPVAEVDEHRLPIQLVARVIGPSGWYADHIVIDVTAFDSRGAKAPAIVRCSVSRGRLELDQWDSASRSGTWWYETAPGASVSCRTVGTRQIETTYVTTALDFQMPRGCCGSQQPPPKPPVVVPPKGDG